MELTSIVDAAAAAAAANDDDDDDDGNDDIEGLPIKQSHCA